MSQLTLDTSQGPPDSPSLSSSSSRPSAPAYTAQESPIIGRVHTQFARQPSSPASPTSPSSPSSPTGANRPIQYSRSQRKPAPSPLQASTAVSPPASASPTKASFPAALSAFSSNTSLPRIVTTSPTSISFQPRTDTSSPADQTYYHSDSTASTPTSPDSKRHGPTSSSYHNPDETRSVPQSTSRSKPLAASTASSQAAMAGSTAASRSDAAAGPVRTSSIDSAISAISTKGLPQKDSQDDQPASPDVSNLIKAAGSPEAVIQYLLKEKQSQAQQNSQLWRLVDKQRAMILGLNKDLERALKDRDRYKKKLKEVLGAHESARSMATKSMLKDAPNGLSSADVAPLKEQVLVAPESPVSDSPKSPLDLSMAPYPITPPADQPNAPLTAVAELLDPDHMMPKAAEHALDKYDHEAEEREKEAARKKADAANDLHLNLTLPPSRSLPSEPPSMPPPKPPVAPPSVTVSDTTPKVDEGLSQFPPPPAPPPRKPPPAPLQLKGKKAAPAVVLEEDEETDTDYDDILEVDEIPSVRTEDRGRRRTREEDDREREILARKEAEIRSLSKKSSKGSKKGTPVSVDPAGGKEEPAPASPRVIAQQPMSLAGVLSTGEAELSVPILSPGLPASPRPVGMKSPPVSPRGMGAFPAAPLSPRPPRQPIPLPPNTPMQTPPDGGALNLTSPKPLNVSKEPMEAPNSPSPTEAQDGLPGRRKVFRGLVTEEYPDLLLPPNALPSVDVRVASSRMKPSRASLISLTQLEEDPVFTLAIFSRADGGELWRVEKDSASLAKLDQRLKQCATFTARTPDRSLFSGHAPAKLDARRIALDQYLDELMNSPLDQAAALDLCKYLSTNTLAPNSDETGSVSEVVPESSAPKTGPGGRPFRSGYLTKRGKNFGGWKARFFMLDGPQVKYYETPGGAHLGTIKLQNAQIGKQSSSSDSNQSPGRPGPEDSDNQYRHAFLILEPKKKDSNSHVKHVLCAENDMERDHWVEALLQWIDYKDPEDEESRRETAGRKKARQHSQPHAAESPDGLIGVRYEATRDGDVPSSAPLKEKPAGQDQPHIMMPNHAAYTISAPKDPQVISDASSWGTKPSLVAPPAAEEKKARKRSFFGFGPKTRSSSDGQDSLFGEHGGTTPPQNQYNGPLRQVFGAPLAEAVRYNAPFDVNVPLPAVVYRCIQYLDAKNAVLEEGIFRLSGSNVVIKQLRERFNIESDVNLVTDSQYHDIHAIASLLKLYLRELPTTILTRDLHLEFLAVTEMTNQVEKLGMLAELVTRLPQANATLLKYLIAFLIKIINNADINKMTVRNVGIVFSPTLNIPAPVFAMFLQNYEPIFGIQPEEYELPSPISEQDPRVEQQARPPMSVTDFPPPRPPTSGANGSPHRQRLMEGVAQRSSPTPPPQLLAQMRSSPTPPPARQAPYELSYAAQQRMEANVRPAYDGGYAGAQGYDPAQYQASQHLQPSYDRPLYEGSHGQDHSNAPAYEPGYGAPRANRRESAMYMGGLVGLNQQGSRNRLREDPRF